MTPPSIDSVPFNASMGKAGGGKVTPHYREQHLAGDGTSYWAGECWLEWDWEALLIADYNFLMARHLAGPTTFVLPADDTRATFYTFTSGAMFRPQNKGTFGNNYYQGVHVEFHALAPAPY